MNFNVLKGMELKIGLFVFESFHTLHWEHGGGGGAGQVLVCQPPPPPPPGF